MSQQAFSDGFPWTIHRVHGKPVWWQRWYEAWLVVSGRYTLWHAFHDGKHEGSMSEYRRVVCNGGDLLPVLDAAIYSTCSHLTGGQEPMADTMGQLRRAAWERYERDRSALISSLASQNSREAE